MRILAMAWALTGAMLLMGQPGLAAEAVEAEVGKDGVQRATMILDSYSYEPKHLTVQVNKPVELTLKSVTIIVPHNFVLKEPDAGLDVNKTVSSGDTEKVRFTPSKPGTYTFYCDKKPPIPFAKNHREKGMEGTLEVR